MTNLYRVGSGLNRLLLWLSGICLMSSFGITPTRAQSVLRQGVWVKIGVTTSGVHKLTQAQLVRANAAFAGADPRLFRLYGNGGAVLPQPNAIPRPNDLVENAIQVTGESDGRFDGDDALLFFGQDTQTITFDATNQRFVHQNNPYADTTFYFLTVGTIAGLRIADRDAGTLSATPTITAFDDYQVHEQDLQKLPSVRSGREWLGEYMTTDTTQLIPFNTTGALANSLVRVMASVVAGATLPTQFRVQVNGQLAGIMPMAAVSGYEYDYQGVARTDTFATRLTAGIDVLPITVTYRKNGLNTAQGYLNYVDVQLRRELRQYGQATWVRRLGAGQVAVRQATSALRVWNVTNPLVPVSQAYTLSSAQEAGWLAGQSGDYFVFTDAQLVSPVSVVTVANQDVHSQPTPNLIIVTPNAWRAQAERLAAFRRSHDGLSVLIVTTQQVYNEFGSGQPDPTAIRDMARYFYQKQPQTLQYLLLFGDATFDYRNISGIMQQTALANTVPVYESRESLHPVLSYSSDDYFGFMDANEGEWPETSAGDYGMDIGVGRLPVKSVEEAQTVVDKLIRYSSDATLEGNWQTRVMLVADDGDYNIHQQDADQLARQIERLAPAYRPERIFLDDFVQENTATGQKVPAVNQLIDQAVDNGRLIINYSGHGGVSILADEQIVTLTDILGWRNSRLPLFVTATCQFGRYDDPITTSGAELTLLSRTGGGIGLLTTARPVYANTNLLLNEAFYNSVFTPLNGQMPRLGDVMRLTKNNSLSGPVNRNFALLGDPSLRLAYPRAKATLTQVNGKTITAGRVDTLKAQQIVTLTGEIRQQDQRLSNFSGTVRATLYDKAVTHTTLGAETGSPKMTYQAFTNTLFTGQVAVQQGQFTLTFTMPKDIDYTVGLGKVYLYAVRTDSIMDASGSYDSLRVGGSVLTNDVDTQPPTVALSVVGGTVENEIVRVAGPNITLQIDLTDNKGINIARSGLGHELTAQLNTSSPVVLNDNYVATGPDGRQGQALYTFQAIPAGAYTVRVKAWDVNNNSGEGTLSIVVSDRPDLRVQTLRMVPNPLVTQAVLTAELNRVGEPLNWTVGIYDLNGRPVSQQSGQCTNCDAVLNVGSWNGLADDGRPLANGLYVVRLQVQSAADGSTAVGTGRVVVTK